MYIHVHVCYICAVDVHATCLLHWYIGTACIYMYMSVAAVAIRLSDIRVHMYNHACVCAHLCDGILAIAPDKTSSCVRIHMYVFSLLHVVQLKGGGGRFVCSVYMYMYDICEWSSNPPVAREATNIDMGSKGGSISCLCVLNRVMPNINN